jgi:hypothetical protein
MFVVIGTNHTQITKQKNAGGHQQIAVQVPRPDRILSNARCDQVVEQVPAQWKIDFDYFSS